MKLIEDLRGTASACNCNPGQHRFGSLMGSAADTIETLQAAEKKAFWSGFEISSMNPSDQHIQGHWLEFKALQDSVIASKGEG